MRDGEQAAAAAVTAGGESSPVPTPAGTPDSAFLIRDPDGALFTLSGA
ncbi:MULTISPECIES: hypothetical protein [unclassified Streptomyces]